MKKIVTFFSLLLLILIFATCNDKLETSSLPEFNKPSDNVRVYTEDEAKYVSENPTENTIIFDIDTPDNIIPEIGTIIQMPISENTPFGFLGKVAQIEMEDKIIIIAEEVALDEAYPMLSIDTTINILGDIIGVYDENDNPIEYTIEEDTTNHTRSVGEFDWENKTLNIPIAPNLLGENFSAKGSLKVSFAGSKFDLDNKDELRYLNLELKPSISLSASITTKIKNFIPKKEFKPLICKLKGRAVVGPVIIPITIPIYFKSEISGDFTSTLQLNYSKSCNAYVRYKNNQWSRGCTPAGSGDDNPWYVTSFDVNGALCAGLDLEFIAGIYTRNAGIGFEVYPNASLSCNASLSSVNPFHVNPSASFTLGLASRVFCMAKLFNKKLEVFDIKLADVVFFNRTLSLFPNISEFNAQGGNASAEISYKSDSYYLLQGLGLKTGTVIYESDGKTVFNTYYPAHTSIDKNGIRYYNVGVNGLRSGHIYYAAPIISFLNFNWPGDLKQIATEGNYTLAFRCSSQSYDVIKFDFSLNNTTGNTLDYTVEASDYDGSPIRTRITAKYDATNKTLSGVFDFYFYTDPGQQRQDGFTVSLANDDSGYVSCYKIIDNGACNAALRIYSSNSQTAQSKEYSEPLSNDGCNIGLYNKYYKR